VHLGHFKNLEEIARAKGEIFEGLEKDGAAVLNADDTYYNVMKECAVKNGIKNIVSFGSRAGAEAKLEDFSLEAEQSRVKATIMGRAVSYTIAVPGEHWVTNSLAVLLTVAMAGADLQQAAEQFSQLQLAQGRGAAKHVDFAGGHFTLVDESYNASPVAVEAAIRVLARRTPSGQGQRILVLGDMKELGEESKALHTALAGPIQKANIAKLFCCGDMMRDLFEALPENLRGKWQPTSGDLAPFVADAVRDGDIVTVKGSHSMGMEKVVQALLGMQASMAKKSAG
jgi:UDP-N-acetylmuramoyl-tripeptide--D-alanyl-D-alanine ligase